MKNEDIEKHSSPSRETKTDKAGSALATDNANPISDSELDGVTGGAIYMKVEGIVKEDAPKAQVAIDGIP
jgi:hypothetical protein